VTLAVVVKSTTPVALLTVNPVKLPTEVILACAFPVTATAVPEVATFKLATCVVLVTTNGAVPTAIVDTNCAPVTLLEAVKVPVTLAPVAVTTNEVFPPAVTLTLPLTVGIFTLLVPLLIPDELIETKDNPPEPFVLRTCPLVPPVIVTLPTLPKLLVPVTAKVPTLAAPVVVKLPPSTVPVTLKLVSVPTLVIFG